MCIEAIGVAVTPSRASARQMALNSSLLLEMCSPVWESWNLIEACVFNILICYYFSMDPLVTGSPNKCTDVENTSEKRGQN